LIRKAFRAGNSVVVALPKEALELLGISEGSDISIDVDRIKRQIILSQVNESLAVAGIDQEFAHQVSEFIDQYRSALDALAKS
jgi:putative addiction module antidote